MDLGLRGRNAVVLGGTRRKNRPWQDDNEGRRPRAICALYAFTKGAAVRMTYFVP